MATVTRTERVIRQHDYVLTLTDEEATALAVVLARVGGEPTSPVRSMTEGVLKALEAAGTDFYGADLKLRLTGSLVSD